MRFRRVTVVALVALMGYTAVAFWVGMPQVIEAAGKIDAWAYVFLLGLTLTNHVIRFLRSRWLLSCLNHDLPVLRYMTYYFFGIAFLATPARVGETIRTFFLRKDGVPYTDSLSILLLERVYDVLAMACLSLLAVAYVDTIAVIATVLLILSFLLLSTRMDKMLNLLVHVGTRLASSWGRWGFQKIGGLQPTMSILLESPRPMLSLGSGLLGFAVQSAGFYFIVSGLGVDAPFWASIGILRIQRHRRFVFDDAWWSGDHGSYDGPSLDINRRDRSRHCDCHCHFSANYSMVLRRIRYGCIWINSTNHGSVKVSLH